MNRVKFTVGNYHTSRSLKVRCSIIAFGDENVVLHTAVDRGIQWDRWTHKFFLNFAKSLEPWFEFKMMICISFSNC
jgi:hypothetical protein